MRQFYREEVLVVLVVQVLADAQAALQSNHILWEGSHGSVVVLIVLEIELLPTAIQDAKTLLPVLFICCTH